MGKFIEVTDTSGYRIAVAIDAVRSFWQLPSGSTFIAFKGMSSDAVTYSNSAAARKDGIGPVQQHPVGCVVCSEPYEKVRDKIVAAGYMDGN